MALITLTQFFYDTETKNIMFKSAIPYEVDYEWDYDGSFGEPMTFYAGSLFTDGELEQVGLFKPAAKDGSVERVVQGDTFGFYPDATPTV